MVNILEYIANFDRELIEGAASRNFWLDSQKKWYFDLQFWSESTF